MNNPQNLISLVFTLDITFDKIGCIQIGKEHGNALSTHHHLSAKRHEEATR